jgi:hypothetical protein
MIDVQVSRSDIHIVVTGSDAWLTFLAPRHEVTVQVRHVANARVGKPAGLAVKRHISGGGALKCAHRRGRNVVLELSGEDRYKSVTLSKTIADIKAMRRMSS